MADIAHRLANRQSFVGLFPRLVEPACNCMDPPNSEVSACQDLLGVHLCSDINGLARIGQPPLEVMTPCRRPSHTGQGRALTHAVPDLMGQDQEALTLGSGLLEFTHDKIEV